MVDEADIFIGENLGSPDADVGAKPRVFSTRPIRKKAYHRALKRGEMWALVEKGYDLIMGRLAAGMYRQEPQPGAYFGLIDQNKLNSDLEAIGYPKDALLGLNAWLPEGEDNG